MFINLNSMINKKKKILNKYTLFIYIFIESIQSGTPMVTLLEIFKYIVEISKYNQEI